MDFRPEPTLAEFRQELRTFLRNKVPADLRRARARHALAPEAVMQWQRVLNAHGWGAPYWQGTRRHGLGRGAASGLRRGMRRRGRAVTGLVCTEAGWARDQPLRHASAEGRARRRRSCAASACGARASRAGLRLRPRLAAHASRARR
ncbi:hypothetical protein ACU4GD_20550 [Cupriavidus basilensis]